METIVEFEFFIVPDILMLELEAPPLLRDSLFDSAALPAANQQVHDSLTWKTFERSRRLNV